MAVPSLDDMTLYFLHQVTGAQYGYPDVDRGDFATLSGARDDEGESLALAISPATVHNSKAEDMSLLPTNTPPFRYDSSTHHQPSTVGLGINNIWNASTTIPNPTSGPLLNGYTNPRAVRHATQACDFCRRRKQRCKLSQRCGPCTAANSKECHHGRCDFCARKQVDCVWNGKDKRNRNSKYAQDNVHPIPMPISEQIETWSRYGMLHAYSTTPTLSDAQSEASSSQSTSQVPAYTAPCISLTWSSAASPDSSTLVNSWHFRPLKQIRGNTTSTPRDLIWSSHRNGRASFRGLLEDKVTPWIIRLVPGCEVSTMYTIRPPLLRDHM